MKTLFAVAMFGIFTAAYFWFQLLTENKLAQPASKEDETLEQSVSFSRAGGIVEIINLPDGTECAVYSNRSGGGGISCNWNNGRVGD